MFNNGKPTSRKFIKWPEDKRKLDTLNKQKAKGDLYFSPALYGSAEATRAACLGSAVTWADVDVEAAQRPAASLLVASGTPGHVHAYWAAGKLLEPSQAEAWNYYNVLRYGADKGGWDITQLLRVPDTWNHKTTPPGEVTLELSNHDVFELPEGLAELRVPKYRHPDILPSLETVLDQHELSETTRDVLRTDLPTDRSASLYRLACLLAEDGLSPNESYAVLAGTDERWGKFVGRADRERRLEQLVAQANSKVLELVDDSVRDISEQRGPTGPRVVGWKSLGIGLPSIEFLVDGVLPANGQLLLAGKSGVGKSQLAIGLAARLVLNAKEWAGFKINVTTQQRVFYASLEMDEQGVKYTTDHLAQVLADKQLEVLEENLLFMATLDPVKLDIDGRGSARKYIEDRLKQFKPTGFVLDTLGAATTKGLGDEVAVRNTMDWVKKLRSKFNVWVVLIAHPRKDPPQNKNQVLTLDDVYGSQIQQADLDAAFILSGIKGQPEYRRLHNVKRRFGPEAGAVTLQRTSNLWLERTDKQVDEKKDKEAEYVDLDEDDGPQFEPEGWQ